MHTNTCMRIHARSRALPPRSHTQAHANAPANPTHLRTCTASFLFIRPCQRPVPALARILPLTHAAVCSRFCVAALLRYITRTNMAAFPRSHPPTQLPVCVPICMRSHLCTQPCGHPHSNTPSCPAFHMPSQVSGQMCALPLSHASIAPYSHRDARTPQHIAVCKLQCRAGSVRTHVGA